METVPMVSARRPPRLMAALAVVTALAGFAVAGSIGSRAALLPTLYVNYTMACTFAITNDSGAPVTSIAPGDYQVLIITPEPFGVPDLSGVYDFTACKGHVQFQLAGPGVNISSTLDYGDLDQDQESATFAPSSTYVAQDLNQPTVAHASFTTTATGIPTAPTTQATSTPTTTPVKKKAPAHPKPTPLLGTLDASVSSAGAAALTYKGKSIASIDSLTSGRYTLSVADHSRKSGFVLKQIGKAATTMTTAIYLGKHSVTLILTPGEWFFYATGSPAKKRNFIVIAPG